MNEALSVRYVSRDWDFILKHPINWTVHSENQTDPPYWLPVILLGPQGLRGHPALTLQATVIKDTGLNLDAYMKKAESELRGFFPDLQMICKWQEPLLEAPTAWINYAYTGNSGQRQELNVTAFIGKGRLLWLQFIAETDLENASGDMPVLEAMIRSLTPSASGIRVPPLSITGVPACQLCGKPFRPGATPNTVFKTGRGMMVVCDACRKPC